MTRRLAPLAAAVLLTLTACGETTDEASHAPDEGPTVTSLTLTDRFATCTVKGKQRAKVTLSESGDGLAATFHGQSPTHRGTVLYSVSAWDKAGEVGVQLGMKYLDGEPIGYFVFDYGTSQQTNLDGSPAVSGKTVAGIFPADALGDLADVGVGSWSAALNVNGNDVGTCPGGMDSLSFPAR